MNDRRNSPPISLDEYMRKGMQDWFLKLAIWAAVALVFAVIVMPWGKP